MLPAHRQLTATWFMSRFLDGQDVVVAAYDFTGKQIWLQRPGTFLQPSWIQLFPCTVRRQSNN